MSEFRKTTPSDFAKWHWDASELMFDCLCGETDIYMDDESENFICKCGKEYKLVYYVLIKD